MRVTIKTIGTNTYITHAFTVDDKWENFRDKLSNVIDENGMLTLLDDTRLATVFPAYILERSVFEFKE